MRIIQRVGTKERSGSGSARLLLTNKKGSYLCPGQTSDFDGLFSYDALTNSLFKTVQDIRIDGTPDTIINGLSWAERHTGKAIERFMLSSNACIYDVNHYVGDVRITLDCKRLYDENTQKRIYSMTPEKIEEHDGLHIHYSKYMNLTPQYTRHVLIVALELEGQQPTITQKGFWREMPVPYDASRGMAHVRWVYDACSIQVKDSARIIITSSANYEKAKEKMLYVLENQDSIILANEKYSQQRFGKNEDIERVVAQNALDSLVTKRKHKASRGVYAGLPWFFQYWMRDEAITTRALLLQGHYALVKEILMRWVTAIAEDNTASLAGSSTATADGPGLVAKRLRELLLELKKHKQLNHFFTTNEALFIHETYTRYLQQLDIRHDLVFSGTNETWMDTNPQGDGREGARIEIQTLVLCIYDLLLLTATLLKKSKKDLQQRREEFTTVIKNWFHDGRGWLLDGFFLDGTADNRIRPNVFLAWYYQPELFLPEEWERVFDHVLQNIWLPWGGLASIDTHDPNYEAMHTGINNKSYHFGDSWYFINNIAAMGLFSINPHKYHDKVEAIHQASIKDLFFQGCVGHASEISNACNQEPKGCFAQAWSAATLIELLHTLRSQS